MGICKLLGHKLIQPKDAIFCERCGLDKSMVQDLEYAKNYKIEKGKSQFIEPITFRQKFDEADVVDDLLEK